MEQTERSEMSAYKIQTPGNHPKERIWHVIQSCTNDHIEWRVSFYCS
jgi:tellurite resistance-related uncharacterized protein